MATVYVLWSPQEVDDDNDYDGVLKWLEEPNLWKSDVKFEIESANRKEGSPWIDNM